MLLLYYILYTVKCNIVVEILCTLSYIIDNVVCLFSSECRRTKPASGCHCMGCSNNCCSLEEKTQERISKLEQVQRA